MLNFLCGIIAGVVIGYFMSVFIISTSINSKEIMAYKDGYEYGKKIRKKEGNSNCG